MYLQDLKRRLRKTTWTKRWR